MSSLEEVYRGGSRWRAVARATVLLAGSLVAAVGFVAATASLIAGFGLGKAGALKVASLLGGACLLVGFLVRAARSSAGGRTRALASAGTAVGVAGLALFWTSLPTGWAGSLAGLPDLALGTYAVGLLAVFGAGVGARRSDSGVDSSSERTLETRRGNDAIASVESVVGSTADEAKADRPTSSAVGDGGEADDELQFFDGEDGS